MVYTDGLVLWCSRPGQFLQRAAIVLDSEVARRQDLASVGTTMQFVAAVEKGGDTFSGTGTVELRGATSG